MLHWVHVLGILQEAVYWGTKLGTEYMDKRKKLNGGIIVNVASIAGKDNTFIPSYHFSLNYCNNFIDLSKTYMVPSRLVHIKL